ncbi:MAG: hypothetical protein KUL87_09155 [Pseudomonas sp.]|nr:hypothetical protein [Pseudomonas sp.]
MTDKAIAEFEAWWDRQIWHECFEDVKDQMRNVAVAFYQKGREDVVVELPQCDPDEVVRYGTALDDCRAAIEAAGVTVRGEGCS